jgi:hypothetical protein
MEGRKINANRPNENGDVEQRHHRLKRAVEQALLLRGSRDFRLRAEYETFLRMLFRRMNSSRMQRLGEELPLLHRLPTRRLDACKREFLRVGPSSTIRAGHNTYSVHSRMMGEMVEARLHAEEIMIYYGGNLVDTLPRLIGRGGHRIEYRHIIDWLVRKPGAFENYRYREDLFPTHRFRVAYDQMRGALSAIGSSKAYLAILALAARDGERGVDRALERLLAQGEAITAVSVSEELARTNITTASVREVTIAPVDLSVYDGLLESAEVAA